MRGVGLPSQDMIPVGENGFSEDFFRIFRVIPPDGQGVGNLLLEPEANSLGEGDGINGRFLAGSWSLGGGGLY